MGKPGKRQKRHEGWCGRAGRAGGRDRGAQQVWRTDGIFSSSSYRAAPPSAAPQTCPTMVHQLDYKPTYIIVMLTSAPTSSSSSNLPRRSGSWAARRGSTNLLTQERITGRGGCWPGSVQGGDDGEGMTDDWAQASRGWRASALAASAGQQGRAVEPPCSRPIVMPLPTFACHRGTLRPRPPTHPPTHRPHLAFISAACGPACSTTAASIWGSFTLARYSWHSSCRDHSSKH